MTDSGAGGRSDNAAAVVDGKRAGDGIVLDVFARRWCDLWPLLGTQPILEFFVSFGALVGLGLATLSRGGGYRIYLLFYGVIQIALQSLTVWEIRRLATALSLSSDRLQAHLTHRAWYVVPSAGVLAGVFAFAFFTGVIGHTSYRRWVSTVILSLGVATHLLFGVALADLLAAGILDAEEPGERDGKSGVRDGEQYRKPAWEAGERTVRRGPGDSDQRSRGCRS